MDSDQDNHIKSSEEADNNAEEMKEDNVKEEKCMPFKLWKFIFTGIGVTTLDVATDIYQCYKHFR